MTLHSTAFIASSKSDSAFDDLSASLRDPRPHPTEDALVQLGRALMTELVDVISDTALEDFRRNSGLDAALDFLPENPLPSVILVEPPLQLPHAELMNLVTQLKSYQLVDSVQMDMAWLERLQAILDLSERLIWVLGILLALAILLVVGNMILFLMD